MLFCGHAFGVRVQRVQKVHKVQRVVVGACGASLDKTIQPGFRPWENRTTALTGVGNAPLLSPAATSPPEGEICSTCPLVLT